MKMLEELKSLLTAQHHNKWMKIKEVCNYVSVSESTIRKAIKRCTLKASNQTGRLLFKHNDVDRWLKG